MHKIPTGIAVHAGIEILIRNGTGDISVGHDTIYFGDSRVALPNSDREALEELGWFVCSETGSWARFV